MTLRCTTPTDRTRRVMACLAVLLWVLGFEVAPNLHLGLHDHLAPHSHDGTVARDDHDRHHAHEHADHHAHGSDHAHDSDHAHADASQHHHHDDVPVPDSQESAAHEAEFAESVPHSAADDARLVATASRLDPAHGDHDLLHRGVAIAQPPLAQPSIAQAPVVVLARLRPLTDRPSSRVPLVARARGPPVQAATCRAVDCTA